jgi:N-acetylmuramoyl-L-alanine amidase
MDIKQNICPPGLKNNPNKKLTAIKYVTIHTTGNRDPNANAKSHAVYQMNGSGGRLASWHYTVDSAEIWQSFHDSAMCWHSGDTVGNEISIGIEICVNDKEKFPKACENAAELTAFLLAKYGLAIENVKQHHDWSGKNCPLEIRRGDWGVTWNGFLETVNRYLSKNKPEQRESTQAAPEEQTPLSNIVYKTLEDVPDWAKETIKGLIDLNAFADPDNLDLTYDMIRTFVAIARARGAMNKT